MKKYLISFFSKFKDFNFIYWFSLFLVAFISLCTSLIPTLIRLWKSICVLGINFWNYLKFIFIFEKNENVLGTYTNVELDISIINNILPLDPKIFLEQTISTITLPFNGVVFKLWWNHLLSFLVIIVNYSSLVILLLLFIHFLISNYFDVRPFELERMDKETKAKKIYCKFEKTIKIAINGIKNIILNLIDYIKNDKVLRCSLIIVIFLKLNIISLTFELIGFLFGFISSFDFIKVWIQLLVVIQELLPTIIKIPLPIYILLIIFLICRKWIKDSDKEIIHQQMILKLLVKNEFGSTNFIVGKPGAGKDLLGTELTIIAESTLRYDLQQLLIEIRKEFPEFPFSSFEHHIQDLIKKHKIINWSQAKEYVYKQANKVLKKKNKVNILLFNYPIYQKQNVYYDELKEISIIDALADYAHAYFMYIQDGVLVASNYPIRFDNIKIDNGHFINYDDYFILHDNRLMQEYSSYSKINNYDWQRVYKKVNDNEISSLDDGVILALSEYAKERGNQLDHRGLKMTSDEINQLNDGTNSFWKTKSHINVIRGKRYGQAFINDQREDSLNADNKEVFEYIWNITNRSEPRSCLKFFWYSRMILDLLTSYFNGLFIKLINSRSDDSLLGYLIKKINYRLNYLEDKIHNRYDVSTISIINQYEKKIEVPLIHKLIYANRYNTSVYGSMYESIYLKSKIGFYEAPEYSSTTASVEEFEYQNSYFINKFYFNNKNFNQEEKEEVTNDAI